MTNKTGTPILFVVNELTLFRFMASSSTSFALLYAKQKAAAQKELIKTNINSNDG
jgi:hypothetical protein